MFLLFLTLILGIARIDADDTTIPIITDTDTTTTITATTTTTPSTTTSTTASSSDSDDSSSTDSPSSSDSPSSTDSPNSTTPATERTTSDDNIEFEDLFALRGGSEGERDLSAEQAFREEFGVGENENNNNILRADKTTAAAPTTFHESRQNNKYKNPGNVNDRDKNEIDRPMLSDDFANRFKLKFHPSWMDYCDPYHCNDYHKPACGLNRKLMKFQWFQSGCHIALNNFCYYWRGLLKFDTVHPRFCTQYVLELRAGCQQSCEDDTVAPVCGVSNLDFHVVLFKNKCAFDNANCRSKTLQEYMDVDMNICKREIQRQ